MLKTISTSTAVGLMLAVGSVSEAQICEDARDMVSEALLRDCRATQPANSTAPPQTHKRSSKWWHGDDARMEFGITDEQSRDLEAIFQQTLPILKAKKVDVDREEQILLELLAEASITRESTMIQAIERLEARRRSLSRTYTMMQYRMYRLLTPEQRAKVLAYHDRDAPFQGTAASKRR
jgi:Spy/CpxP family protein refolding chaperone